MATDRDPGTGTGRSRRGSLTSRKTPHAKTNLQWWFPPDFSGGNRTEKRGFIVRKPPLLPWYGNRHYFLYLGRVAPARARAQRAIQRRCSKPCSKPAALQQQPSFPSLPFLFCERPFLAMNRLFGAKKIRIEKSRRPAVRRLTTASRTYCPCKPIEAQREPGGFGSFLAPTA